MRRTTYAGGDEPDSGVDAPQRGDIDSLTTDSTSRADTGRVFTRTTVNDSINEHLDGVLVGHEVDDLEGVLDDANGQELLAVVAAVHHQRVGQTLNNGALGLTEALNIVTTSAVGDILVVLGLLLHRDVVLERDIADNDIAESPERRRWNRRNASNVCCAKRNKTSTYHLLKSLTSWPDAGKAAAGAATTGAAAAGAGAAAAAGAGTAAAVAMSSREKGREQRTET